MKETPKPFEWQPTISWQLILFLKSNCQIFVQYSPLYFMKKKLLLAAFSGFYTATSRVTMHIF
jgi:hypothetical protein